MNEGVKRMKRVRFDIDENDDITGVRAISLVDDPAIKSQFVVLKKDNAQHQPERIKIHIPFKAL